MTEDSSANRRPNTVLLDTTPSGRDTTRPQYAIRPDLRSRYSADFQNNDAYLEYRHASSRQFFALAEYFVKRVDEKLEANTTFKHNMESHESEDDEMILKLFHEENEREKTSPTPLPTYWPMANAYARTIDKTGSGSVDFIPKDFKVLPTDMNFLDFDRQELIMGEPLIKLARKLQNQSDSPAALPDSSVGISAIPLKDSSALQTGASGPKFY